MGSNLCLKLGNYLCSPNELYKLEFQDYDGNLVIHKQGNGAFREIIWVSGSDNKGAIEACLSVNGNLGIFNERHIRVWNSRSSTSNVTKVYAEIQDNGTFAIYNGNISIWSTGLREIFIR